MQETALRFKKTGPGIPTTDLQQYAQGWLLDGEIRRLSKQTLAARRFLVGKLFWFLQQREYASCGALELRAFLAYVSTAQDTETGRWGNAHRPQIHHACRPVKPRTVQTYFGNLRTLFRYLVMEGVIEASPMETLRPPVARPDQIQPFSDKQVEALLDAARKSRNPRRDTALMVFMLDSGARASEVCGLKVGDVDLENRRCTVLGKGGKHRTLPFGGVALKAIYAYLTDEPRGPEAPLFLADRGTRAAEALTRSGLLQLFERLGKAAKIEVTRCSPHSARHSFAVAFLRAGGNVFTLRELLGHTTLAMTNRYLAICQTDIEQQHRQYSPMDRLTKRR